MIDLVNLSDADLLELLDQVSEEVKRRSLLSSSSSSMYDEESLRRAVDLFAEMMQEITRPSGDRR
jgi:hypothetical protein